MTKIIASVVAFITMVIGIILGKPATTTNQLQPTNHEQGFYLTSNSTNKTVSIYLNASGKELSAISLRVSVKSLNNFTITDQNIQSEGVQIETNKELLLGGWSFPVNKVVRQGQVANVDLAAVFINANGFKENKDIFLGTISLKPTRKNQEFNFDFDPALSKVIDKNAKEIN